MLFKIWKHQYQQSMYSYFTQTNHLYFTQTIHPYFTKSAGINSKELC